MTDKVLNDYYIKNKDLFLSLANCVCVSELLLKLTIYGKKWSQWDWAILLECISMVHSTSEPSTSTLYDDIIHTIDTTDLLDAVFTKKDILLSIMHFTNSQTAYSITYYYKGTMLLLLAHVFKKFPDLWTMSWMIAKFKDKSTKQWTKYHRLGACLPGISRQYSYTHPKECYDKFIKAYLKSN